MPTDAGPARLPRRLAAAGGVQLAASGAAVAWLASRYEDAGRIVLLHVGLVLTLWLSCVLVLGVLAQLPRWRGLRPVFGLLPGALFVALFTVYVADAVALGNWGHTVSFALLRQFLGNLPNLIALVPLRSALVIAAVAIALWAYWRAAAGLDEEVRRLFSRRAPLPMVALIAIIAALATASAGPLVRAPSLWNREPLASLLDARLPRPDLPEPGALPEGLAGYSTEQRFRRANVIVIVADALRAANMGVYGYERPTTPFLSGLHASGELLRVDLGLATCSQSVCGVLSLLGSQAGGRFRPEQVKLHDVLRALGYRVSFLLSGAHREWRGLGDLFGPNVDLFRDDPTNDDANLVRALRQLPDADADRPDFLYLHLMSAHWFGVQLREYQRYQPTARRFDWLYDVKRLLRGGTEGPLRQHVVNRYDNAVLQTDAYVERLFELLAEKGYLEDAIVVVTADHGEALGERGPDHYGHGMDLYQELIRIPILLRDTRAAGSLGDVAFASQADVAPSVLDRLGIAVPPAWDGRSVFGSEPRNASFHEDRIEAPRSRSGREERTLAVVLREPSGALHKLLHFRQREGGVDRLVRRELYELQADPGERRNLIDAVDPATLAALEARLSEHFGTPE